MDALIERTLGHTSRARKKRRTAHRRPCVCKGMQAPSFATGIVSNDEAFCKTMRLLSQETFIKMGMKRLKSSMICSKLSTDCFYHFKGLRLPVSCQRQFGWRVITEIASAGAYPGPYQVWIQPTGLAEEKKKVLKSLHEAGCITELYQGHWQITDHGFKHLHTSWQCRGFEKFSGGGTQSPLQIGPTGSCWIGSIATSGHAC